jgi:eukaryotic-like serine/threonine-protein kinase
VFEVALQKSLGSAYQICRELPGASMSRVFVAWEPALEREVVVKVLPHDLRSTTSVAQFRREILVTAQLVHPHILPVIAAGGDARVLWYVMPYIAGGSVARHLGGGQQLPVEDARRIARELLSAVTFAHRCGIVHRDIKPGNVLLAEGHAILADFGMASVHHIPELPDDAASDLRAVERIADELLAGRQRRVA